MTMSDYAYLSLSINNYVWLGITLYSSIGLSMALNYSVWSRMIMYDYIQVCMTACSVRLFMTKYNSRWLWIII